MSLYSKQVKIKDVASQKKYSLQIGPYGLALTAAEYTEKGVPLLRGVNINEGRFFDDGFVFISQEKAATMEKYWAFPNDILTVHKGTIGKIGIIPQNSKFPYYVMGNSMLKINCDENQIYPKFLFYYLKGPSFQIYLNDNISQTGVPQIMRPLLTLREFKISLPEIAEQKIIALFLDNIDSLIEIKNDENNYLEKIADNLFKLWFLMFEPFQDQEMIETELGLIPKGWKIDKLENLIEIKHGYAFQSKYFSDEETDFLLLTPGNFKIGGGFQLKKMKYYDNINETVKDEFVLNKGDLLVTMTDLSIDGDTLGYPAFIPPKKDKFYLHNQRLGKIIIKNNKELSKEFLYCFFKTMRYRKLILGSATGTTVKHTAPERITGIELIVPPKEILSQFNDISQPIFEKILINFLEIQYLTNLRDYLLPHLISGQIPLK